MNKDKAYRVGVLLLWAYFYVWVLTACTAVLALLVWSTIGLITGVPPGGC